MATWPTDSEINAFLVAAGITLTSSLSGLSEAAQQAWELDTGWVPFLSTAQERKYDPPRCNILLLDNGLLDLAYVKISDTEVTEGTDFWQYPANTDPKLWLKFNYPLHGTNLSIAVSGNWGYSDSLPADVYEACLRGAGLVAYNLYQQGAYNKIVQDDVTLSSGNQEWASQVGMWKTHYETVVNRYRFRQV